MSAGPGDLAVMRLALLQVSMVELPHPERQGQRIVGFCLEPDEHWHSGEGLALLRAYVARTGIDLAHLRNLIDDLIEERTT